MPRRFDLGRALLVAGALLLIISLFVRWYDTGLTGWQVFEAVDLLLAALGLAAIWAAVRADLAPEWLPPAIAVAALGIVAVQLIDPPPAAGHGKPATGAWLALAASIAMVAGSILSEARLAITVEVREHERRRRVPAVDRRTEPGFPAGPADTQRTQPLSAVPEDDVPKGP